MSSRPKDKIVTTVYSCDVCGLPLCDEGKDLPSFRVSTYLSKEVYEHYCDKHTLVIDEFVKQLKEGKK